MYAAKDASAHLSSVDRSGMTCMSMNIVPTEAFMSFYKNLGRRYKRTSASYATVTSSSPFI